MLAALRKLCSLTAVSPLIIHLSNLELTQSLSRTSVFTYNVAGTHGIASSFICIIAFDEGERILILPWAQAGCQIDLRDFRPGDRLTASTSCATVSDMVTKLCFALVSTSRTLPTSNSVSFSTSNCVQQTTKSVNRSR